MNGEEDAARRRSVINDYKKNLRQHKEFESRIQTARENMRAAKKAFAKTEDDLKSLQSVGQIIGEVLRPLDNERLIVKASSGPRYVVGCRSKVDKEKLTAGTRVVLDMTTLTIMRALPREKMLRGGRIMSNICSFHSLFLSLLAGGRLVMLAISFAHLITFLALFMGHSAYQVPHASSVVVPQSNCYVLDNSSHIYDFTDWIGQIFEYEEKDADLVVRFCKDVERRSQKGYIDFGRFATSNDFVVGSGRVNFFQGFYNGDLMNCESSFDKMGRTAKVNIICGNCLKGHCKGQLGCICNVTYDPTMCRAFVDLAIPCGEKGLRIFEGFTVGFHPRTWEVVYNGLTQLGFEKAHNEFSFGTEQTHVSLYLTAISALSELVGKPTFKVKPDKGLEVKLTVSQTSGSPPTTLSPSIMTVNWRCETAHDTPYEVVISIPVEGYEPIEFTLTKLCEHKQEKVGNSARGWATFGVLSCIFVVLSTVFCCGGFIYKTRVEHQHGLDALPGMTILSACLETVSGGDSGGDSQAENSAFINQTSWEHVPVSGPGMQRTSGRSYGTV